MSKKQKMSFNKDEFNELFKKFNIDDKEADEEVESLIKQGEFRKEYISEFGGEHPKQPMNGNSRPLPKPTKTPGGSPSFSYVPNIKKKVPKPPPSTPVNVNHSMKNTTNNTQLNEALMRLRPPVSRKLF